MITQEQLERIVKEPEKFKLLEKVPFDGGVTPVSAAGQKFEQIVLNDTEVSENRLRKLVILDTETTGIDNAAELIELAFCVCTYDVRTRTVLSIDCCFDAFSKPEKELSQEVSELTHITNDMLPKQKLSYDDFKEYLPEKCLVVAHNASFDRRILERTYPYVLADLHWADSMTEIDWRKKGFNGKGLELLLTQAGYWYEAHRAINDVLALLWLIISTGTLAELCNNASKVSLEVRLSVSYAEKDQVKELGFRWHGDDKTWSRNFESMAAWQETQKSLPKSAKTVLAQVLNSQTRFK
jgi:DNA polymerase-3 subunit epsilon